MNDEYPPGDTLSGVDDERALQDLIDAIIASDAGGGADPDMGMGSAVIESNEDIYIQEDDITPAPTESKLRLDERQKQMEEDKEGDDLFSFIFGGRSR
jgi:hypothetical protein